MDINGLHQIVIFLREDFKAFRNNEFKHLSERVDKLSVKIAWMLGGFTVLNGLVWVLVKVLG